MKFLADHGACTRLLLASANRRVENVLVLPIVIAELKLRDIERHILGADLVERADNAALEDAPKAFNRVRVDRADNILVPVVVNSGMAIVVTQTRVAGPRVSRQQTDFVGNGLINEIENADPIDAPQNTRNHIALALHCANDRRFATEATFALIQMAIAVFAADESFINLDNAAELFLRLHHRCPDFVAHGMCSLIRAKAHLPLNLQRRNAFLAGGHQMNHLEPLAQRLIRVFEDRPGNYGKAVAIRRAFLALPVPLAGLQFIDRWIAAARALHAFRPA